MAANTARRGEALRSGDQVAIRVTDSGLVKYGYIKSNPVPAADLSPEEVKQQPALPSSS